MRYFLLPLLLILSMLGYSQVDQKPEQLFLDAEYYRLYEEYSEALPLYQRLLNQGYDNAHINYRIGECYLEIPGRKERAIPYLEKATKSISKSYREGSFKETNAPVYSIFYLGKAYQINNELEKALDTYSSFLSKIEDQDNYNMSFVNKQIQSCKNARKLMAEPVSVEETNLGENINNAFSNIKPVVNNDETKLIFTSKLKFYDAVFMSQKDSNEWTPPVNLTPQIKSDGNLYSSSLDNKAEKLLLLKSNPYNGDLYVSEYDSDKNEWKEPGKLGKNINSQFWETHGCFHNHNRTIYFTSNRKGGMGGLDIYVSHFDYQKKMWLPPKNLGENINTPYNEETPFITGDGKRLYFSSQGHYGMGGFDIFYVEKMEDGSWSEPVNIGYPVNTTGDDLFFCPVQNGKAGYMAKFSREGFGNQDIYRFEFNPVEKVTQVNLFGNIRPDLRRDVEKKDIHLTIKAMGDSTYQIDPGLTDSLTFSANVKPGKYKVVIEAEGYATIDKTISIGSDYSRKTFEIQANLEPEAIEIKNFIQVDNIYFGYDTYSLANDAKEKLNELAGIMSQYPDLTIEIVGHTDSKGSVEYNKKLSEKRAETVLHYLKKKGISTGRMSSEAKGEEYPLAINTLQNGKDCAEGRKYNRRVEIIPVSQNNNYIIKQTADIPQNLKKRGAISYSILLLKQKKQLPKDYFENFENLKDYTIKEYYNGDYLYLMGRYENQNEAIEPYKKILNMGFSKARILSSYQLTDILNIQSDVKNDIHKNK